MPTPPSRCGTPSSTAPTTNGATWEASSGIPTAKQSWLFNSVDQNRSGFKTFAYNNSNVGVQLRLPPITGNNCLAPITADSEGLGIGGSGNPGAGTYASPPSWIGSTNRVGKTRCVPTFAALHDSDYSLCDFRPNAGSSLIDSARHLMRANGAGNNAATINLKSNGGSADARNFFIGPNSYLQPRPPT